VIKVEGFLVVSLWGNSRKIFGKASENLKSFLIKEITLFLNPNSFEKIFQLESGMVSV